MMSKVKAIKWVNVILFFSLALNFFVAGFLASDMKIMQNLKREKVEHHRPEIRIVDYFPKEQRRELRHLMMKQRENLKPVKVKVFASQKKILEIIAMENVDEALLRNALNDYQKSSEQLQNRFNDIMIDMVMKMDHDTRLKIYKQGQRAHDRWKMDKKKPKKDD